ncbi:metalloregulator ArsR/SmtB family transcription factor [Rhodococcus sp. H36-A4]|uniref:ArsR/SmtB family transcription factor n=1 Tax=Rhodococcus sp. H36-A4 TaxID=3004353 RepID=UPI0022B05998|nr:metalloregulator ArsR/SmtB family transcription factor [Rhodococcus sp. H36-A4]MCZ4076983.1 metalloregulator ArsR/SmtB family transcription factor [Rhodococcus sp. H36-A4]
MLPQPDINAVFKALADPTRRALLDALRRENAQKLGELCEGMSMARQSVTKHLDLLVAANLVVVVRKGRERRHFLNPEPIHDIERRWIRDFDRPHLDVLGVVKQRAEDNAMKEAEQFPDYVYVTYIRASAEQVWEALTDADITAIYWGGMANVSGWEVGASWTHRFDGRTGHYDIWGKVLESDRPNRLVFTFQPSAQALDEPGSVVTYQIEPVVDAVKLTVSHTNVASREMLNGISHGWPTVLANLKSYLETGTTLPSEVWQMQNATELTATEN